MGYVTASARDVDGFITKVEFYKGTALVGTDTTDPYNLGLNSVGQGSFTITAKATDNLGAVVTSAPVLVTIKANAPPTVSLIAPPPAGDFIEAATIPLSSAVADTDGMVGKVSYYRDGILLGSSITAPNYPFSWNNAPAGTFSVTARATDDKAAVTTSSPITVTVKPNIRPTVALATPANNATFASLGIINLTADASDTDGTISKVVYYQGTTNIGTAWVAPFSFTWRNIAIGSYRLTAQAYDNKGGVTISVPVDVKVNQNISPTISLASPVNNAVFVSPAIVPLVVSTADVDGTIAKVEYFRNGIFIGTSTVAPFSYNWNISGAAAYSLTARATDNKGAITTSAAVSITVKANVAPTVSMTAPTANTSYPAPATIVLAATAADTDGAVAKVDFYNGTLLIGSDSTAPYAVNWANVASGTYNVTAKATDDKGGVKTSIALPLKVVSVPLPTVSISAPTNNATYMAPASFTLTANAAVSGDTISKVEYISGPNIVGTALAPPFSVSLSDIGVGTYTVTARATAALGGTTMSPPIRLVVNANSAPFVTLDATPVTASAPAVITLSAAATDSDGSVVKVEFFNGATLLVTDTEAPYSFVWNGVGAESYQVSAKATDNLGAVTTSAVRLVTVTAPAPVAQVYYVYSDQINTAREITDAAGAKVWQADPDPFGANLPDENPAGHGAFVYNPRFPGQYFDRETGLHYNYYRDYDPQTGRYIQSDPIGLEGGINTYGYVGGNPLSRTDSSGLFVDEGGIFLVPAAVVAVATSPGWVPVAIVGGLVAVGTGIYLACQPDKKEECEAIRKQIHDLEQQLAKRRGQLAEDQHNLYNRAYGLGSNPGGDIAKKGTFTGHVNKIVDLQVGLSRLIEKARKMGCL